VKQVIFRREARADALEAYRWYEQQEPGLGAEFREELRATIQCIRDNAKGYRVLLRETRRARLKRFPYGVFFREFPDALVIVAVMHTRRHPKRWQRRQG
jgi:plasmid stabilization system protein ParE